MSAVADSTPQSKQPFPFTALLLTILGGAFSIGCALTGPGLGYRLLGGVLAVVGVVALITGVLAILYAWMKIRTGRADAAAKPYLDQLDAMSDDQLRESTLAAIRETGYFTTTPATEPVNPSWPRDVREVFERFDQVSFTFTGETKPYFTLDRTVIELMPQYRGALKVGTMFLPKLCVAIHLPTGRSVMGYGSAKHDEIERTAAHPVSSHRSLWRFMAAHAVWHRVGLLRKQGTLPVANAD